MKRDCYIYDMRRHTSNNARQRIIEAALERFNYDGILNVSAEDIIARADVAKVTFYKYFPTKTHLAAAFVHERSDRWIAWLKARIDKLGRNPLKRLLGVFDALGEWFASDDYNGCPFHRAAADFPDPENPVHIEVVRNKALLRDFLTTLVKDAGLSRQTAVVSEFMILTAGSEVMTNIEDRVKYAQHAQRAASRLIREA